MSFDAPRKICAARGCDDVAELGETRCPDHLRDQIEARNARKAEAKLSAVARVGA